MVKIPEEKFSYETICNSFLIFHFPEREREEEEKEEDMPLGYPFTDS